MVGMSSTVYPDSSSVDFWTSLELHSSNPTSIASTTSIPALLESIPPNRCSLSPVAGSTIVKPGISGFLFFFAEALGTCPKVLLPHNTFESAKNVAPIASPTTRMAKIPAQTCLVVRFLCSVFRCCSRRRRRYSSISFHSSYSVYGCVEPDELISPNFCISQYSSARS